MSSEYWITTIDNDVNPFTHFSDWWARDRQLGYNTCQLVSNFIFTSNQLDQKDIDADVDFGIAEFLARNPFGRHYKVYKDEADTLIPLMYSTYVSEIKEADE